MPHSGCPCIVLRYPVLVALDPPFLLETLRQLPSQGSPTLWQRSKSATATYCDAPVSEVVASTVPIGFTSLGVGYPNLVQVEVLPFGDDFQHTLARG
jgi:hypothetical protein